MLTEATRVWLDGARAVGTAKRSKFEVELGLEVEGEEAVETASEAGTMTPGQMRDHLRGEVEGSDSRSSRVVRCSGNM